jgi:hypothetical protein
MRCRGLRKLLAWVSCPKENGDEGESARGWSSSLEGCSGQLHVTALSQSLNNSPYGLYVNISIRNFIGQSVLCMYMLLLIFNWKL